MIASPVDGRTVAKNVQPSQLTSPPSAVFFQHLGACRRRTPRTCVDLKAPKDAPHPRPLRLPTPPSPLWAPRRSPSACAEKTLKIDVEDIKNSSLQPSLDSHPYVFANVSAQTSMALVDARAASLGCLQVQKAGRGDPRPHIADPRCRRDADHRRHRRAPPPLLPISRSMPTATAEGPMPI